MTVVMDGVPISSDAGTFFRTMDLDEIARLEVLSPGDAAVLVVLTLGTPLVVTVSDRFFRRLR